MAKLIVISSDDRQEFELGNFNSIGRHPDNTIQILDRIISKEHAQIQRAADGRFLLRDLKSLNGTFLRGERVGDHLVVVGDGGPCDARGGGASTQRSLVQNFLRLS